MSNQIKKLKKAKVKISTIPTPSTIQIHSYLGDFQGCGTIRIIYPHILLNQWRDYKHNIGVVTSYNTSFINDPNFYHRLLCIQFQRAITDKQLQMLQWFKGNMSRQTKTPIVYESDDDLLNIPPWNMAHDYYETQIKNLPTILRTCDGITVSTEPLKKLYSKYNKNIVVIPNHLPKFIWGDRPTTLPENKKPRILWGGSANHFSRKDNLKGGDFSDEFIDFIKKTVDKYEWVFIGAMPMELEEVKDKVEFHNWKSTFEYANFVKSLNIDIGLAPLEDNVFNQSKSNIKVLEYTAAGIAGIYSDVYPYRGTKNICSTTEHMIERIEALASNPYLRQETIEHDYDLVKDNLYWEENDNLRKYLNSYLRLFKLKMP